MLLPPGCWLSLPIIIIIIIMIIGIMSFFLSPSAPLSLFIIIIMTIIIMVLSLGGGGAPYPKPGAPYPGLTGTPPGPGWPGLDICASARALIATAKVRTESTAAFMVDVMGSQDALWGRSESSNCS